MQSYNKVKIDLSEDENIPYFGVKIWNIQNYICKDNRTKSKSFDLFTTSEKMSIITKMY